MLIKDIPNSERPRERMLRYGVSNLSNEELLAIIIKNGTKGYSAKDLGILILKKVGQIENLKDINIHTLEDIKGLGVVKRMELLVILELGKRIYLSNLEKPKKKYINPKYIYHDNQYLFNGLKQEYFYVCYLDQKKNLIERKLLFMGTLNKSLVHPREIFKEAYLLSASSIICMHNHPSGDIMPSADDIFLTNSLIEIGKLQQIPVVDHIIFGNDEYYSFYENDRYIRQWLRKENVIIRKVIIS